MYSLGDHNKFFIERSIEGRRLIWTVEGTSVRRRYWRGEGGRESSFVPVHARLLRIELPLDHFVHETTQFNGVIRARCQTLRIVAVQKDLIGTTLRRDTRSRSSCGPFIPVVVVQEI